MILWTSILLNIIDVDVDSRNKIIYSKNVWEEVYMNEECSKYLSVYGSVFQMIFHLLGKYEYE